MSGVNNNGNHSPNGIAAMFVATGQDVANLAESSAGLVYAELLADGAYYYSITIPALIVATYGGGRWRRLGREVEDHAVQIGAGDPVDHAVMDLGDQRPAILGESFDHPVLPQRVIAVEPLRHHPRHQLGELLVAAGLRQGGPADVIAEIKVRVVHPDRPPEAERHRAEFPAVKRHLR